MDDIWELLKQYEERFNEFFGTSEWLSFPRKHPKAIELIKRALERGSPVTDEEYFMELLGLTEEEYELLKEGKLFI